MVSRYWSGEGPDPEELSHLVEEARGGIPTDQLVGYLSDRGWHARPLSGDHDQLGALIGRGYPAIALIRVGPDAYHYVVVVAVTDGSVVYHDPARAPFQVESRSDFRAAWSPTEQWALLARPPGAGLAPGGQSAGKPASSRQGDPEAESDGAGSDPSAVGEPARRLGGQAEAAFHDGRYRRSVELARRALRREPSYGSMWRIVGAAQYMQDREAAALGAWNELDEPRIRHVRTYGLRGIEYQGFTRHLGLQEGRLLTPSTLAVAERRARELAAVEHSTVAFDPPRHGRVDVSVSVLESEAWYPSSLGHLAQSALRFLARRELEGRASSLLGSGETAALRVDLGPADEGFAYSLSGPMPGPWLKGVRVQAVTGRRHERFRGANREGSRSDSVWETRTRRVTLRGSQWLSGGTRLGLQVGLLSWPDQGLQPTAGTILETRNAHDRIAARGGVLGAVADGERTAFGLLGIEGRWRSSADSRGVRAVAEANVHLATERVPLSFAPAVGVGPSDVPLLRSKPTRRDGYQLALRRADRLAQFSIEPQLWPLRTPLGSVGAAVFMDMAWQRPPPGFRVEKSTWHLGWGAGLRFMAGQREGGTLAVDIASDERTSSATLSVRWSEPWPDWTGFAR